MELLHGMYIATVIKQPVAFIAGGLFDDTGIPQVVQSFANGGIGKTGQLFQFGDIFL